MPLNVADYAPDWKLRSEFVRFVRAEGKCEWCGAEHLKPHPVTGSKVVLTTAHVHDRDKKNCSLLNLAALCQRCHLRHDKEQHSHTRRRNLAKKLYGDNGEGIETATQFIHWLTLHSEKSQRQMAAGMDISPSHLSRKLAQSPDDSMRFTLDDLERWVEVNGDLKPLFYLVQKHAVRAKSKAEIEAQIAELKKSLEGK